MFLLEAEGQVILKIFNQPASALHPFTVLPLIGQLLLLITLLQEKPGWLLTFTGIAGIGILLVMMFVVGLIGVKVKIVISTLPFIILAFITIRHARRN